MKKLAWLGLAVTRAICNPAPPVQVPETAPTIAAATSSARADADMPGPGGEAPAPPPPPTDPFQPVSGSLGGTPWELKGAGTTGPVQSDGTVALALANYPIDCGLHEPGPGDRTITLVIPWQKGATVDLGSLKAKAIGATTFDEKKKKPAPLKGFKPKGTVEVVGAPTKGKSSGRIKIDLTSGTDAIKAELPVRFCFPG